jgi:hypothetical protein
MKNKIDTITRNKKIDPSVFQSISTAFIKQTDIFGGTGFVGSLEEKRIPHIIDLALKDFPQLTEKLNDQTVDDIILNIGSFLGETLLKIYKTYGASWKWSDNQERWVIGFKNKKDDYIELNVFYKIEKRIKNGMEDSIEYCCKVWKDMIAGKYPQ